MKKAIDLLKDLEEPTRGERFLEIEQALSAQAGHDAWSYLFELCVREGILLPIPPGSVFDIPQNLGYIYASLKDMLPDDVDRIFPLRHKAWLETNLKRLGKREVEVELTKQQQNFLSKLENATTYKIKIAED